MPQFLFTSDCTGAALLRTRKILDRWLPRLSSTVWEGRLTEEALTDVHQLLRRSAKRNSAITCYQLVRKTREIRFVVGRNARKESGSRHVGEWHRKQEVPARIRLMALAVRLAGYMHDLGKATQHFQGKLRHSGAVSDSMRHEVISTWLAQRLLSDTPPATWHELWTLWDKEGVASMRGIAGHPAWTPPFLALDKDKHPVGICSISDAVLFMVFTHHRPLHHKQSLKEAPATQGKTFSSTPTELLNTHRTANTTTIVESYVWDATRWTEQADALNRLLADIQALWQRIQKLADSVTPLKSPDLFWQALTMQGRACLVLADHEISSRIFPDHPGGDALLMANTKKVFKSSAKSKPGAPKEFVEKLNQPLDEHLRMVGDTAATWVLTYMRPEIPYIGQNTIDALMAPSGDPAYAWQDRSVAHLQQYQDTRGHLVFNIAGTGAGKTITNLKCLAALSPTRLRVTSAFNLRTLTLQTSDQYLRDLPAEAKTEIACVIGDALTTKLHETPLQSDEESGTTIDTSADLEGEADVTEPENAAWALDAKGDKRKILLAAPILVSTLDMVSAAGELHRQGHHARALLRLAHSDLILDEVDSLDVAGFVATLRMIKHAALLGRNIVISSATVSPLLAGAIFSAWQAGISLYTAWTRQPGGGVHLVGDSPSPILPVQLLLPEDSTKNDFLTEYRHHAGNHAQQALSAGTKLAKVVDLPSLVTTRTREPWAAQIRELHDWNHEATTDGPLTVSLGLIRVANISSCFHVAESLAEHNFGADTAVYVTTYHARDLLIRRSWKEKNLDFLLTRKRGECWFDRANTPDEVRTLIEQAKAAGRRRIVFIVVATPVEEVGRDHDFDWAIIEPSSMASIIQTAGRVNRHRRKKLAPGHLNVVVLDRNFLMQRPKPTRLVYVRPGFQQDGPLTVGATHCKNNKPMSASALLIPGLPFRITAALILANGAADEGESRFAKEDALGIQREIAPAETWLKLDSPVAWMTAWCALRFPLRERDDQLTVSYDPDTGTLCKLKKTQGQVIQDTSDETTHVRESVIPNTWLSPAITDSALTDLVRAAGFTADKKAPFSLYSAKVFATPNVAQESIVLTRFGIDCRKK